MKRLLPSCGCSQEDHVPNCGHFGESGTYLGRHVVDCEHEKDRRYECTCNPSYKEKKVKKSSTEKLERDYWQMFNALQRITCYQTPQKLRRSSEKDWGLSFEEALEGAYENIQAEAKHGLKGVRRPKV